MSYVGNRTSGIAVIADGGVSYAKLAADVFSTDTTWSGSQRGAVVSDNDLSFDLTASNNFSCTPTGNGTLTFTNMASATGQSGLIKFVNGTNYTISRHANTKISDADLTAISNSGTYLLTYFCDGTNVYVVASRSLV